MITPTQLAAHLAASLDGDYDDGIERAVSVSPKGTLMLVDLKDPETGDCRESFIVAVVAAPCPAKEAVE